MPCRGEYLEATKDEIKASQLCCLIEETITGVHVNTNSGAWRGYHPEVYNNQLSREWWDAKTALLCAYCTNHDMLQHSLEMQIWWRNHRKADQEREEDRQARAQREREAEDRIIAHAYEIMARRKREAPL